MKFVLPFFTIILLLGCSTNNTKKVNDQETTLPPKLDDYFNLYCRYTGNLGIGFVASHTYDFRFRQRLAQTDDPELKRLYVILNMFRNLEWEVRDFEKKRRYIGKNEYSSLTQDELDNERVELLQDIEDLKNFVSFTNYSDIAQAEGSFNEYNPKIEIWWTQELEQNVISTNNNPTTE